MDGLIDGWIDEMIDTQMDDYEDRCIQMDGWMDAMHTIYMHGLISHLPSTISLDFTASVTALH